MCSCGCLHVVSVYMCLEAAVNVKFLIQVSGFAVQPVNYGIQCMHAVQYVIQWNSHCKHHVKHSVPDDNAAIPMVVAYYIRTCSWGFKFYITILSYKIYIMYRFKLSAVFATVSPWSFCVWWSPTHCCCDFSHRSYYMIHSVYKYN